MNGTNSEQSVTSRFRSIASAVFILGAFLSLFFSPMPVPVFLVCLVLGLVAGVLANLGDLTAPIALFVLIFGVEAVALALGRKGPDWRAAWWQPPVIAVAASVAIGFLTGLRRKNPDQHG